MISLSRRIPQPPHVNPPCPPPQLVEEELFDEGVLAANKDNFFRVSPLAQRGHSGCSFVWLKLIRSSNSCPQVVQMYS